MTDRKFFVYPYKAGSQGAKMIRDAVDGLMILLSNSKYKFQEDHIVINWGNGDCPFKQALNHDVMGCIDKIEFFQRLEGTGTTPKFRTHDQWKKEGFNPNSLNFPIFMRSVTDGYDGAGISIADNGFQLKEAKLYVEGIESTGEYRVHIGRLPDGTTTVIGVQKKVFITPPADAKKIFSDKRIMCGDGVGLSYIGGGSSVPSQVTSTVDTAFAKFPELTFGAFDVVMGTDGEAYVLEVNSAPMMTETLATKYADFFKKYASLMPALEAKPTAKEVPQPQPQPETKKKIYTAQDIFLGLAKGEVKFDDIIETYVQKVNQ